MSASTLAGGVRQHYAHTLPTTLDYERIAASHEASIMEFRHKVLDFHREIKCVMLDWGWVIETSQQAGSKDIIKETLVSYNGKVAVITARKLVSPEGHVYPVWKCMREDTYPVGSIVRLVRAEKPLLRQLCEFPPF